MTRRSFIAGTCATLGSSSLWATTNTLPPLFSKPLPIPPILEPKDGVYSLHVKEGYKRFFSQTLTSTYGVNGDFLGPTMRFKQGEQVRLHVSNALQENVTLHWHGMEIPGRSDGGPHQEIIPNTTWVTGFQVMQPSSMCWYHPHTMHQTGKQVYMGIAGLIYIDDPQEEALPLPRKYGIDDIPVVLQDRRFDTRGEFLYVRSMHDQMMGLQGNVLLANGEVQPFVDVSAAPLRLRLLNGSNARIYQLGFDKDVTVVQIAGDSSLLPKPVPLRQFYLAPGERVQIVVDLSSYAGENVVLYDGLSQQPLVQLRVAKGMTKALRLPAELTTIARYQDTSMLPIRKFELNFQPGRLAINNKQMNMQRIDETVTLNSTEIWEISNPARMPHPFHIHGTSFKIISRNGRPPLPNETGLKDTVLVYGGEIVRVAASFHHVANKNNPYMYHCHILEHEDAGMMGQFTVE